MEQSSSSQNQDSLISLEASEKIEDAPHLSWAKAFGNEDIEIAEQAALEASRESLLAFTVHTHPDYRINWHHRLIAQKLEDFVAGKTKRLIVACPPRMGKSELISRRLPSWIFGKNPNARIIACSYNADLAHAMNRDVQRIMLGDDYAQVFPDAALSGKRVAHSDESWKRSTEEFEVVGHRGYYKCAGVGGGITGRGADFLLVDDPIKGRQEADSPTVRSRLWDWFQDDLKTRLDGDGGILVVATRWHEDDLTGMLVKKMKEDPDADQWEVLTLPCRLDEFDHPEDPRNIGEVIWPWWYAGKRDDLSDSDIDKLSKEKVRLWEHNNSHGFASLGQQSPAPRSGNMFKVERVEIVNMAPAKRVKTVRYWDKAGTEGGGCFTVGLKMSLLDNGAFLIEHVVRGQWSAYNREKMIKDTAILDGKGVIIVIEKEGGSGGKESAENSVKNLVGWVVRLDSPSGDKTLRADPLSSQVEGGNVYMLVGDWNHEYKEEMRFFPSSKYKDQIDASSGAFNYLTAGKKYSDLNHL